MHFSSAFYQFYRNIYPHFGFAKREKEPFFCHRAVMVYKEVLIRREKKALQKSDIIKL